MPVYRASDCCECSRPREWNGYVLGGTVVPCVERKHDVGVATICPVYLSRKAQSEAWSQRCRIYYIQVLGRFGP